MLCEALSSNDSLFMLVEETLKDFGEWMCGKFMTLHVVTHPCHYPDGLVHFITGADGLTHCIIIILKSSTKESATNIIGGLVLGVGLIDRVLKLPNTTVKSIPHGFRLAFSQALKIVLYNMIAQPGSTESWICLLLLPHFSLQVFRQ